MDAVRGRGTVAAEAVAARWRGRIAARLAALLPGAEVEIAGERIAVRGRGLFAQRERDPALRWIGGDARWE